MKHWQLSNEANGIVVAVFDKAGESANSLSAEVMAEFGDILDQLDKQPPKGLIVRSGKEAGFIAGADIEEFSQLDSAEKGRALVTRGWNLFNRLAAVPYPTLALVRGHCLGGGLELAWPVATWWRSTKPVRKWVCPKSCSASSRAGAACCACPSASARLRRST
jgi:3-hydroxyacyl-CoA dehydrogenase/enoyl-CoA hydratase/3-hydroxybutyryl-CoA epimerase